ncbi:SDR family NAD(P)-dependent oxidoreductase [Streptomyces sp. NPDC127098]|uniref:SDR family NAD(P)-dependent oxidoreductase n=1 Tax=Streptomyces sp. NPDC127098 TaxID=3347137 RepID=UPI0036657132
MTIVLITGADKGIGFETARRLTDLVHPVWIGARDAQRGQDAADVIGVKWVQIDVTADHSIAAAMATIEAAGGPDVLVDNAVIPPHEPLGDDWFDVFNTHTRGVVRTQAALPLPRNSDNPGVVNPASSLGSFGVVTKPDKTQSQFASGIYGTSKVAVAMLSLRYSMAERTIKFNAVEPGYTNTDSKAAMPGGHPVTDSARGAVERVLLPAEGPTGTLVEDGEILPW